MDQTEPN